MSFAPVKPVVAEPLVKPWFSKRDNDVTWGPRDVNGKVIEAPVAWSDTAVNIAATKYLRNDETSIETLIHRVAITISSYGFTHGYFDTEEDKVVFYNELYYLLVNQYMAFNSPVWFNVGLSENPQCSACFILRVDDNMESIIEWWSNEAKIFRGGSGSGINLSALRGSSEAISGRGTSSGPVSFMRAADSIAGSIKSGGKTRRAAKMVILDADHPDIEEFIVAKAREEEKVVALRNAGFDMSFNGDGWQSIQYQNANNSVRVTDEFMEAVEQEEPWSLTSRVGGSVSKKVNAADLFYSIAEAAWRSGDPGLQFDTTINNWHTTPTYGRINASNPCSEYMHVDNSACNLASLNLLKFYEEYNDTFLWEDFKHAVDITVTAQDIIVGMSSYPTEEITANSKALRQLGLGFTNLGALLMVKGLPYDSDEGRTLAAEIASMMSARGYHQSARLAERLGPIEGWEENKEAFLGVIRTHMEYSDDDLSREEWTDVLYDARDHGIRNAQISVVAPTGTISFLMDAETTGIEPLFALESEKTLVGGGVIKQKPDCVVRAYQQHCVGVGYYIYPENAYKTPLFATAVGENALSPMAHLKMMAAVQPFISGAISKTVNMPADATIDDVVEVYMQAWKLGLKSIAIYRDGSKGTQPLKVKVEKMYEEKMKEFMDTPPAPWEPEPVNYNIFDTMLKAPHDRKRLPGTRRGLTHKFSIASHEGYVTTGEYEDGTLGEIFISMSKEGSTLSGLLDSFATAVSLAIQYGVPLEALVEKFKHTRYEPSGITGNTDIRFASSIVDYIFTWLEGVYLTTENEPARIGTLSDDDADYLRQVNLTLEAEQKGQNSPRIETGEMCSNDGTLMYRAGTCYVCPACGETTGCS